MGEHNSPAFRDGRADHQRRNDLLSQCPPVDLDLRDPGKWGGPWMYLRGYDSIEDAAPHCCDRCNGKQGTASPPGGSESGAVDVSGAVDIRV